MTATRYVFADDEQTGATHHSEMTDTLAEMLDPLTTRRLDNAGIQPGWRCLEVGAGSGSIASWLADQVGDGGQVVATDTDPEQVRITIDALPRVKVVGHNIAQDPLEPLGTFDLIHARLVLGHLANRREVLDRLASILNPGGVLVVDEFAGIGWDWCPQESPDPDAFRLFREYDRALTAVLRDGGVQVGWGRQVARVMEDAGLTGVDAEFWSRRWRGGEAGCRLPHLVAAQKRDALIAAGMAAEDIDAFRDLLLDPELEIAGNLAVSTIGRQPGYEIRIH